MFYSNLAIKSLVTNRKQYMSLFLVCVIGVALILSTIAATDGMFHTVRYKSKQYYGGDIQFLKGWHEIGTTTPDQEIEILRKYLPDDVKIFKRYDYDARNANFFYEGTTCHQRVIKGVDFDAEKELFDKFKFVQGEAKTIPEHNSIIISQAIADMLSVSVGDQLIFEGRTVYDNINTTNLIVTGIFQDTSLFGMYTSYADIRALRSVLLAEENYTNRICLYYGGRTPSKDEVKKLQQNLSTEFNMYPLVSDKNIFYDTLYEPKDDFLYALITLDANITELELIVQALKMIVMMVTLILIVIISVGTSSTYKVIVMKRINEIGTYRALGMKPEQVALSFIIETSFLMLAGFVVGVVLGFVITWVLSLFNLSFIPSFDMFLLKGRLLSRFDVVKGLLILIAIYIITQINVLITIQKAVHISPVGALATTN